MVRARLGTGTVWNAYRCGAILTGQGEDGKSLREPSDLRGCRFLDPIVESPGQEECEHLGRN